ncbi:MAG: SH3 domain-containing protein [Pseudomonadota bacterium]
MTDATGNRQTTTGGAGSFGPVLFFGLTAFALITYKDPTPPLPNPSEVMEFASGGVLAAPLESAPVDAIERLRRTQRTLDVAPISAPLIEDIAARTTEAAPLAFPNPSDAAVAPIQPRATLLTDLGFESPQLAAIPSGAQPIAALALPLDAGSLMQHRPSLDWATVTGNRVHLRAGPDGGFESLIQFDAGTRAIVTERAGDWARINVIDATGGPATGWMFARFLVLD